MLPLSPSALQAEEKNRNIRESQHAEIRDHHLGKRKDEKVSLHFGVTESIRTDCDFLNDSAPRKVKLK